MTRLQDKVALVTGTASNPGLGWSIAHLFAREGARVVVTDLDEEGIVACVDSIRSLGAEVVGWRQDVTSESEWQDTIDKCLTHFGKLDVLVNNAGIAVLKPVVDLSLEEYEKQMQVNMTSVFLGTRGALKAMLAGGGGSIVNMSSVAGLVGVSKTAAYAASKGGVRFFSKTVALEHSRNNIRCNTVHPGIIWTNMNKGSMRNNPADFQALKETIPMGRMGEAEEVAQCVLFLASDESSYVTGTELTVDGGLTAQ